MPTSHNIISKKDSPRRWPVTVWPSAVDMGFVLIRKMSDAHLSNAISWAIRRKGHRPRKFQALVDEAIRRRLPLPNHKWIKKPSGYDAQVYVKGCLDQAISGYNPALRD